MRGNRRAHGDRDSRARAGTAGVVVGVPWIPGGRHVLPVCELVCDGLAHDDSATFLEASYHGRVVTRHETLEYSGAGLGGNAFGVAEILDPNRDPVQRAAPTPSLQLMVGRRCLPAGPTLPQRHVRVDRGLALAQPVQP